eukprot:TRINITY_DN17801_c0_g1_i1.p1 TRINITY_DN17801_c0_g1~~TRINITY_DN17801_c0_g1_i1.p1  ORF type:complete len:105 (-),score=22.54 TRINITY_DN17801_c0_g1_i1:162-476(-)
MESYLATSSVHGHQRDSCLDVGVEFEASASFTIDLERKSAWLLARPGNRTRLRSLYKVPSLSYLPSPSPSSSHVMNLVPPLVDKGGERSSSSPSTLVSPRWEDM